MSNSRTLLFTVAASAFAALGDIALAQERLGGTWLTEDGSTRVTFRPCGNADCGEIVWLREPVDPETGKDWRDKLNPDDALRRRPLVGLTMISDLKETGQGAWAGALYNPLDGQTYAGRLRILNPGRLELEGCALAGLFCQTETWARVD